MYMIMVFDPLRAAVKARYRPDLSTITYKEKIGSSLVDNTADNTNSVVHPINLIVYRNNPEGFNLDATFLADFKDGSLNISWHDIVEIYRPDPVLTQNEYTCVFSGFCVLPGAPFSSDGFQHQYRLIGLHEKTKYIDTLVNREIALGTDLGAVMADIIASSEMLPIFSDSPAVIVGKTLQQVFNPSSVDLYSNLEALTAYGRTQNENLIAGTTPNREILLRAKKTNTLAMIDGETDTITAFEAPVENIISGVRWNVADGSAPFALTGDAVFYNTVDPLTTKFVNESVKAVYGGLTLDLTPPQDVYKQIIEGSYAAQNGVASFVGETQDPAIDYSRFHDANPNSYIVISLDGLAGSAAKARVNFNTGLPVDQSTTLKEIVALSLNFKLDKNSEKVLDGSVLIPYFYANGVFYDPNTLNYGAAWGYKIPLQNKNESFGLKDFWVFGDRARNPYSVIYEIGLEFEFLSVDAGQLDILIALEDLRFFILDTELLDGFSQVEMKLPKPSFSAERSERTQDFGLLDLTFKDGQNFNDIEVEIVEHEYSQSGDVTRFLTNKGIMSPEELEKINVQLQNARRRSIHNVRSART